jgi:hypothetical protein
MSCCISIEFGNKYKRKSKHLIQDIIRLTGDKGDIDEYIKSVYNDTSNIERHFNHIFPVELFSSLQNVRTSGFKFKDVENKGCNITRDDVEFLKQFKQDITVSQQIYNKEMYILSTDILAHNEKYKTLFTNNFTSQINTVQLLNECLKNEIENEEHYKVNEKLKDITNLMNGDMNIEFYKDFILKYQRLVDIVFTDDNIFYLYVEKTNALKRIKRKSRSE